MAKGKATVFFCQDCGYESSKWMGQCPGCGGWNTFVEEVIDKSAPAKVRKEAAKAEVVKIADIKTGREERLTTGLKRVRPGFGRWNRKRFPCFSRWRSWNWKIHAAFYRCAGIFPCRRPMYYIFPERNPCSR